MKILIVIDMQNDFIDGALKNNEAKEIIGNVKKIIENWQDFIIFTRDTHSENYMNTLEGKNLPVPHCLKNTWGWEINSEIIDSSTLIEISDSNSFIKAALNKERIVIDKENFSSLLLAESLQKLNFQYKNIIDNIVIIGICTDICVVSNSLLMKAFLPETNISVISTACAGVTPQKHLSALDTMKSCHIEIL